MFLREMAPNFGRTGRILFLRVALLLTATIGRADDRLILDAKVNGHPVRLMFDTGFGPPFGLWRYVADQFGFKRTPPAPDVKAVPGQMVLGFTEATKVEMAGRTLEQVQFAVVELPSWLPADTQGLIGWSALKENPIVLRVADHSVTIGEKLPPETANWLRLSVLPKTGHDLRLQVPGTELGHLEELAIDTGDADGVNLSPGEWEKWRKAHSRQPMTLNAYYNPIAGMVVREEAWADELSFNGLVLHGVAIKEASAPTILSGGPDYAATFGLAALRRLDLAIDGEARVAYVRGRIDPPPPYAHNRLGAVFIPKNDQNDALFARVAADSPAALAGVLEGDQLLAIDGLDVTKWRTRPGILPLAQFWEQPTGTKLVLTLERQSAPLKIAVTLRNILGPP